jgi:hypothetical protein
LSSPSSGVGELVVDNALVSSADGVGVVDACFVVVEGVDVVVVDVVVVSGVVVVVVGVVVVVVIEGVVVVVNSVGDGGGSGGVGIKNDVPKKGE